MRYLSVCSGIEAATVAWHELGWEPAAFSEIEKFPSDVLKHHYPSVPNMGDMTKFEEWNFGAIDLLVGGTPCQSFSVAGLRKGLDDPRGNLMLTYLAIARKHRPKWLVWENVPGVLSSNGGEDFASLLRGLVELGYGWAYRILDAQYFGVAQRRRRVFVIGCLGDWHPAAAVLFERQSLRGDPAPSREKREGITCTPEGIAGTVSRKWSKGTGGPSGDEHYNLITRPVYEMHGQDSRVQDVGDVCTTVTQKYGTGGGNVPVTISPVSYRKSRRAQSADECESWVEDEVTNTINVFDQGDVRATQAIVHPMGVDVYNQIIDGDIAATLTEACGGSNTSGPKVIQPMLVHGTQHPITSDVAFPLATNHGQENVLLQPIPIDLRNAGRDPEKYDEMNRQGVGVGDEGDAAHTITSACVHGVAAGLAVRRLTPIECERLQGFPDNYTNIRTNCPDGPRYKALGNSMAVPVMAWIGRRINELQKQETS